MGFLLLPLLGAPSTDHRQRQQVLEQLTYTGYSRRGLTLHLYTKTQPISGAQEQQD